MCSHHSLGIYFTVLALFHFSEFLVTGNNFILTISKYYYSNARTIYKKYIYKNCPLFIEVFLIWKTLNIFHFKSFGVWICTFRIKLSNSIFFFYVFSHRLWFDIIISGLKKHFVGLTNPQNLSFDSYMVNHSVAYAG